MPKIFENEIVFNHSPIHTLLRLHKKYPNPHATHVVSVDAVERSVDPISGVVRSERIIGVQQGAPKWITKLFSLPEVAYVREITFIDPAVPSATMMSVNLNLAQYVSCLELITYTPHPPTPTPTSSAAPPPSTKDSSLPNTANNTPQTLFWQRAMMVSQFPTAMIARRIEKASVDRFRANADVGRKGFEWVLSGGQSQG